MQYRVANSLYMYPNLLCIFPHLVHKNSLYMYISAHLVHKNALYISAHLVHKNALHIDICGIGSGRARWTRTDRRMTWGYDRIHRSCYYTSDKTRYVLDMGLGSLALKYTNILHMNNITIICVSAFSFLL